jgi:AhpD family alkylhydroperoxidase
MEQRLDIYAAAPEGYKAMLGLETYIARCGLEKTVVELVKMRASQINGCAFCLDMHSADARKHGESERRLHVLPAWREVSWFNERERAALAWTESLTLVAQTQAPDADFEAVRKVFSDKEIADLTLLIATINGWNRLSVGLRKQPPALNAA